MHAFLLAPLLLINLWHAVVLLIARRNNKSWRSISESAVTNPMTLGVHRIVHILSASSFFVYAVWLWQVSHAEWLAVVLAIAALFDIIQVMTLSKRTRHYPVMSRDVHQISAWLMAVAYLAFSLLYVLASGIGYGIIICYTALLATVFGYSALAKHKYFWLSQMIFFATVSGIIAVSGSL